MRIIFSLIGICITCSTWAQIRVSDYLTMSSYERLGISSSLRKEQIGSRLNLLNQGSIGGCHEETDYIDIAPTAHISRLMRLDSTAPHIALVMRWQFFSGASGGLIFDNTQAVIAEAYILVDSMYTKKGKHISVWMGQRYYRQYYSRITDYFFYNNLTAQGIGITIAKCSLALMTTVPQTTAGSPYGDVLTPDFQRLLLNFQYKQQLNDKNYIKYLGEVHSQVIERIDTAANNNANPDVGLVAGALWGKEWNNKNSNELAIRYGYGLANGPGDDNWSSRTYVSYGNPNKDNVYKGAFAINVVEQFKIETNPHWDLELYGIYRYSEGAKNAVYMNGFTRENKKQDISIGARHTWFLKD